MLTAEGIVKSWDADRVVFQPSGTTYELYLKAAGPMAAGQRVRGVISLAGRKLWTVAAGGGFITPILGEPRVVQGRVLSVENQRVIVQAGTVVAVEMPKGSSAMDLKNGGVVPGVMVNVTIKPGAEFTLAAN